MKNRWLILALFLLNPFMLTAQKSEGLNVMTFNIRLDHPNDGIHNWKHRKDAASELILKLNTDIVGTQEVLHQQLLDLLDKLSDYAHFGVGRADGHTAGEYSTVLYRKDRFELLRSGTFWLSDRPNNIASVGWDASMERIVSWGILKSVETGNHFAVFNTHFDHRGTEARRESASLLLKKLTEIAGNLPVILTGDFNATPESEPIQIILQDGRLHDASVIAESRKGPDWTFHGFGRRPEENRRQIDYIFLSKEFEVSLYYNIFEEVGSTFHSDHNPVFVTMEYMPKN